MAACLVYCVSRILFRMSLAMDVHCVTYSWCSSFASVKTTMMKEWFYICLIMVVILLFLSLN